MRLPDPSTVDDALRDRRLARAIGTRGVSAAPIYDAVWRQLLPFLEGDVLDFGAGTGTFTRMMRATERVRSVTAVDLAPPPESLEGSNVRWLSADLNTALSLPGASFDVITAVEVIEHLENPRAVAREWYRLLRPGGTVLLSTPNVESWRALLSLAVRGHFVAFLEPSYPAHISALTAIDLRRALTEAGFQDIDVSYTGHGRIPQLRMTWQRVFGRLARGRRTSDNVVALARKP